MTFLEQLPNYEKLETYPNYRIYTWHSRSDNEYDYSYDLQIIYFKHFVILRDSDISIGELYRDSSHQEEPVIVNRLWFDVVHPLDNSLEKAKRFLTLAWNNVSHETKGDLVEDMYKIPLNGFWVKLKLILNYALSEYNHDLFCEEVKKNIGSGKYSTLNNYLKYQNYYKDLHHESRSKLFEICFYLNVLNEQIGFTGAAEQILDNYGNENLILTLSELNKYNESDEKTRLQMLGKRRGYSTFNLEGILNLEL